MAASSFSTRLVICRWRPRRCSSVSLVSTTSFRADQFRKIPFSLTAAEQCALMMSGERNFWELVHGPFMNRDVNRADVRAIIAEGLKLSGGSYKRLLEIFGIARSDYLKFMD